MRGLEFKTRSAMNHLDDAKNLVGVFRFHENLSTAFQYPSSAF